MKYVVKATSPDGRRVTSATFDTKYEAEMFAEGSNKTAWYKNARVSKVK